MTPTTFDPKPKPKPNSTEESFFLINTTTEEIIAGPTTSRKAQNIWKKTVNFGDPISTADDFVVCWDPETVFQTERNRAEISRLRRDGETVPTELKRWENERTLWIMANN